MGSNAFKELLAKRKDRMIAVVLGFKDTYCDEYLPNDVSRDLRSVILDQVNEYHDFAMDVFKSMENDSVIINDDFVERMENIHDRMVLLVNQPATVG